MAKFNTGAVRAAASSPIVGESIASGSTYEGGPGYARDIRAELFLLAVSNLVGEDAFYESGADRDSRYEQLVRAATAEDPVWLARFLGWLRGSANLRSAALVGAATFAAERIQRRESGLTRQVVGSVLQRADEPGELLAYWTSRYGRSIPKPVKRGISDAAIRLYNEQALLKYDSDVRTFRFGDVLELTHPAPHATWQGDLFRHAIDRRHGRDNPIPESLGVLRARAALTALPVAERRAALDPQRLRAAGMTWEAVAGWLQGPLDAEAWTALIPTMGFMALLRNLRNFDEAGVADDVAAGVAARLADPEQVARSRQLPMRFLSAYRAVPSLRWGQALETALGHSLTGVPALPGRSLILVDTSSSMQGPFSKDGTLLRWDAAVVFGLALALRAASADLVSFSSTQVSWDDPAGARTKVFPLRPGESLLRGIDRWDAQGYFLGGGTAAAAALGRHYAGHDRIIIVTDEQAADDVSGAIPADRPLYTWNLGGYRHGHAPSGSGNRHTFGGLTDAAFRAIPLLEAGRNANWPF